MIFDTTILTAIEPLTLQGNIRLAAAILYGMLLGLLLSKLDFSDRSTVKQELVFNSMKMAKTLLLALALGMIAFAMLRNAHVVQANIAELNFWGVLMGAICTGIGLGIIGLTPLTAVTALASGRLYTVWVILGMLAAFPAANLMRDLLKDSLGSFSSGISSTLENSSEIWNLNNPYLWLSALLVLICVIMQFFGTKESK